MITHIIAATVALLASGQPEIRSYDYMSLSDMDAIAQVLRRHIAHLQIEVKKEAGDPMNAEERDGFGIVLDEHHVAALSFLFEKAGRIQISGPKAKPSPAKLIVKDTKRRVAIIKTEFKLSELGLFPARESDQESWKADVPVFTLSGTTDLPSVLRGWMTHSGAQEEYEGHPRINMKLSHGMPVFDPHAHFIGYARNVAWDVDKQLLIPMAHIKAVQKSIQVEKHRIKEKKDSSPKRELP